ncbi:hypothetical protein EV2_023303 [Malus domestica]
MSVGKQKQSKSSSPSPMLCSLQGSLLTLAIFTLLSFIYFSLNPSCRALLPLSIVQDRALSSSFHVLLDHSPLPPLKPLLPRVPGYTTTSATTTNNHQQRRRRTTSNSSLSSHSDEGSHHSLAAQVR